MGSWGFVGITGVSTRAAPLARRATAGLRRAVVAALAAGMRNEGRWRDGLVWSARGVSSPHCANAVGVLPCSWRCLTRARSILPRSAHPSPGFPDHGRVPPGPRAAGEGRPSGVPDAWVPGQAQGVRADHGGRVDIAVARTGVWYILCQAILRCSLRVPVVVERIQSNQLSWVLVMNKPLRYRTGKCVQNDPTADRGCRISSDPRERVGCGRPGSTPTAAWRPQCGRPTRRWTGA